MYLFGAHIFSQFLLKYGLYSEAVIGILDNDSNKWGKRLYGTEFIVYSPKILSSAKETAVIVKMGAYTDEIICGLKRINSRIEII